MKVKAAAKINLMLDVVSRLENGYHSLFMIMQSVGCYDTVTVTKTDTEKIEITCADARVPCNEKNIAYKAAQRFFDITDIRNSGVFIDIQKQIPMAAGLAGGSADGAAVLYCLNELFGAHLPSQALCEIGLSVGADVPFSLTGGTALALDIGGVLAPLKPLKDCYIVLAKPMQDVATVGAYKAYDEAQRIRHFDKNGMLRAMVEGDFGTMCDKIGNVFEQVVEVQSRPYIKTVMRKCGAAACCMSGSGPTVFGIFEDKEKAEACAEKLHKKLAEVFVCEPVRQGIEVLEA